MFFAQIAAAAADARPGGLLAWQLRLYPDGHVRRGNLVLHALTAPLFCAGTVAVVLAPLVTPWLALGALGLVAALVAQGRGHRGEATRPVPFRGPGDFIARFVVEKWITFPRFVLSGEFARAAESGKPAPVTRPGRAVLTVIRSPTYRAGS